MKRIGITLGDPSGIGPEIIARALAAAPAALRERCLVFGDAFFETPAARIAVTALAAADRVPGRPTPAGGAAQVAYLEAAVQAVQRGELAALVTGPISKTQVQAAGFAFPGHTEFLAARLGAAEHAMMFVGPKLRVVLATIHIPLAAVPHQLTAEAIGRAIFLGGQALHTHLGIAAPRIGVLGLNPHAGEGGLFGDEEARIVGPGIELGRWRLADAGIGATVEGPLVPDAAFRRPDDLFVALYHDQGLIPVKLIDFELAVNVTLGLPVVRTSPDHGVAYDIAGPYDLGGAFDIAGRARPQSFAQALNLAAQMIS